MRTDELMGRLARILDDPEAVAGLRFVVADHAIPTADAGPREPRELPPPAPDSMAAAEAMTESIEDPALRDLVARAAARSIDRSKG